MSAINNKPLLRSCVCKAYWDLYTTDKKEFQKKVKAYFQLGMPGWKIVKASYSTRTIYLKDERSQYIVE